MTNAFIQLIENLIKKVNATPDLRDFVCSWVGAYYGKIIQLETDQGTHHIVLEKAGTMLLRHGAYPSPDVIYKASTQTLLSLFTGQASFRDLVGRWDLVVIGAGHESIPLGELFMKVLTTPS